VEAPESPQAFGLELLDGSGRLLHRLPAAAPAAPRTLDLSGYAPGLYLLQCKPTTNPIPIYPIPSSFGFQNCGSSSPSSDILQPWIRLSTSFSQISGSIWYCLQAEKKV